MTDFKPTSSQTRRLLGAVSCLTFRPMTDNDFAAFAGAEADAEIAFCGGDLAEVLSEITGEAILTEGGDSIAVICSGTHIEISAVTPDLDPVAIGLDLQMLG